MASTSASPFRFSEGFPDPRESTAVRLSRLRERCLNPGNDAYKFYGGKGVTICGEWRDAMTGFPAFVAWAKDQGYEPGLWIDRIDPDADYRPANCRWITARENILTSLNSRSKHSSHHSKAHPADVTF